MQQFSKLYNFLSNLCLHLWLLPGYWKSSNCFRPIPSWEGYNLYISYPELTAVLYFVKWLFKKIQSAVLVFKSSLSTEPSNFDQSFSFLHSKRHLGLVDRLIRDTKTKEGNLTYHFYTFDQNSVWERFRWLLPLKMSLISENLNSKCFRRLSHNHFWELYSLGKAWASSTEGDKSRYFVERLHWFRNTSLSRSMAMSVSRDHHSMVFHRGRCDHPLVFQVDVYVPFQTKECWLFDVWVLEAHMTPSASSMSVNW